MKPEEVKDLFLQLGQRLSAKADVVLVYLDIAYLDEFAMRYGPKRRDEFISAAGLIIADVTKDFGGNDDKTFALDGGSFLVISTLQKHLSLIPRITGLFNELSVYQYPQKDWQWELRGLQYRDRKKPDVSLAGLRVHVVTDIDKINMRL